MRRIRKDELPIIAAIASAIGSLSSAVVAIVAVAYATTQAAEQRHLPFRIALYTARLEAERQYITAADGLFQSIAAASIDLPHPFRWAELDKISDAELAADAIAAKPVDEALNKFQTATNQNAALWSPDTSEAISATGSLAKKAGDCIGSIGLHSHSASANFYKSLRRRLAVSCPLSNENTALFGGGVANVLARMSADLAKSEDFQVSLPQGAATHASDPAALTP